MIKKALKNNKYSIISFVTVIVFFGIWELVAFLVGKPYILPRFSEVIKEFFSLLTQKDFYVVTFSTLGRCLLGFIIALISGVGIGILGGISKTARAIVSPFVSFLRTTPTMALTLIIMVWLRNKYTPVLIGLIMVFPIIYRTVCDSLISVDGKLKEMIEVYGVSTKHAIKYLYVPEVLPVLLGSLVTAFGLNIKAVVSAEILAYTVNSIGLRMYFAKQDFFGGTATLFAWVLTAIILSVVFELILGLIQKKVCKKWN